MNKGNLFKRIYSLVKKIPTGRVATYGQIAKILEIKDARKIGWALHANRDPDCPCHRVVNKEGRLAPNFAFDGPKEQRRRLLAEGISFKNQSNVDLSRHLWRG